MPNQPSHELSRRGFLSGSASCGAYLLWMSANASLGGQRLFAAESDSKIVAKEPWARIEELHDGVWAVISTPIESKDWKTLANGGILAGKDRVLVVDSFASPDGGAWVAQHARELTGRWPTDVVITHYHGDHANGLAGFVKDGKAPRIWMTPTTAEPLKASRVGNTGRSDQSAREGLVDNAEPLAEDEPTIVDLGGRKVHVHPRSGHTASDLTLELEDPNVVFYGDLLWNRMFPNFRDTTPSVFAENIRAAMREKETLYVPGHGALANKEDIERLLEVLAAVEETARSIHGTDVTVSETAAKFKLPESLGEWHLFSDSYFEVAISAWLRELGTKG